MRLGRKTIATIAAIAFIGASAGCSAATSDSSSTVKRSAGDNSKAAQTAYVVWRIDDVPGDSGCSLDVLKSIMKAFSDSSGKVTTPVVLGIIARTLDPEWDGNDWKGQPSGAKKMTDAQIKEYNDYLRKLAKDNPDTVEIASHTYQHPAGDGNGMSSLPAQAQTADLAKAQATITKYVGVTPTSLVLPENAYNADTITAMKANGLSTQSAQCTWGESAPGAQWPWHSPSACTDKLGAATTDETKVPHYPKLEADNGITYVPVGATIEGPAGFGDFFAGADLSGAVTEQDQQMRFQGYAATMLHVQEFAPQGQCTPASFQESKTATLEKLIAKNKQDGWTPTTLRGITAAAKAAAKTS